MELILQSTEDALLRLLNFSAIDPSEDDDDNDTNSNDDELNLDDDEAFDGRFPATDETEALEDTDFDDDDDDDDPLDELRGSELY